ncbi:GNAT family N-acetyltransferase [Stackebrandtia soli]|uniref:GNAT family N-acetyltransferase n=1 Tax=Stackebrandtia soli TaxID=1892856 RepID=UPI0039EA596C
MLGKNQIGKRVVVRRAAEIIDGRRRYRDVIGELLNFSETTLWVRRDSGEITPIPRTDVVASKEIPPKPVSYKAIAGLERAAAETWPATETHWIGAWLLRASGGWTNRANTALPLGAPVEPLDDAIDEVSAWYTARGLTPGFAVPLPLSRRIAARLGERGWRSVDTVSVQTAAAEAIVGPPDGDPTIGLRLTNEPGPGWLRLATAAKGAELPPHALDILGHGADRAFLSVGDVDAPTACARGAISGSVAVVSLVIVSAEDRRGGIATAIMRALAAWAIDRGASTLCVQVVSENQPAIALYQKLGFVAHHSYVNMRP